MRKLITLSLAVLLVGLSAAVVYAAVQPGDDSSPATGTTETTETTTTPQHQQHERERHRDRERERARGANRRADDRREGEVRHNDDPATGAVDVSGPCDEAEHANDPRCAGGTAPRVEDDQQAGDDAVGHDQGDDHRDRNQVEDNSGPGNSGDDGQVEDNSGPGHGGDDGEADDHSGSGHGGGGEDD
jgi:hypothetical protein